MNTQEIGSQFIGTPWVNDQEIYDFASERRDVMGWDWNRVKAELVAKGLSVSYADAIIENMKMAEEVSNTPKTSNMFLRYLGGVFLVIVISFVARLLIGPIYPGSEKFIGTAVALITFNLMTQGHKGNPE